MPDARNLSLGLIGAGFVARAFAGAQHPILRAAYAIIGLDLARTAWSGSGAPTPIGVGYAPSPKGKLAFTPGRAHTIEQRVGHIGDQMIRSTKDPGVYQRARGILSRRCGDGWCIPERDWQGEVAALFADTRNQVRYTMDPVDFDAFQTARKTLELHTGDCDDMVIQLGAMLRSVGYRVRMRIYHTRGFPTWNHIALRCQLPNGEWMTLDPIVAKPPGWEVPQSHWIQPPKDFDVRA